MGLLFKLVSYEVAHRLFSHLVVWADKTAFPSDCLVFSQASDMSEYPGAYLTIFFILAI